MWEEKRDPDSFVHVSSVNAPREVETTMEPSDEEDREAVWGTLLELYLAISAEAVEGRERMRSRALSLLSKGAEGSKLRYEPTQALIVCLTHDFVPGIVLLYDRLGMVEDILRFWIERAEDDEDEADEAQARIFETLEKYGDQHPELYPIALRRKILSPIEVIEILSKPGSCASIGTVKKYLLNQVLNQKHQINSDMELINSYRKEIDKNRSKLESLADKPQIFHLNNKCASCMTMLDLPVVHFMCHHSYHQRCLGDHESCLKCGHERKAEAGQPDDAIKEMMALIRRNKSFIDPDNLHPQQQQQQQHQHQHQLAAAGATLDARLHEHRFFIDEVHESDDPFSFIASSFSKGLL
ncbi:uncharacterized protein VP01_2344g3 [Puccinia sorghi]|uniref:RING-type domain-containing protein n=1 Tax=Puccinia sorghi TaxID=27349 RepID=A0A0L6V7I2_9BASI|nr:uncharacterized protein VP01_2344g3 [Puccinia sorghi]